MGATPKKQTQIDKTMTDWYRYDLKNSNWTNMMVIWSRGTKLKDN